MTVATIPQRSPEPPNVKATSAQNGAAQNGTAPSVVADYSAQYTNDVVKEALMYSGRGRPLRVVCIGAGAGGIALACKLPRFFVNGEVDFQIYEKNSDVGGTWFENRYPGCACDIPSHLYAYTFAPNTEWSYFYSGAKEIHRYFKNVCTEFNCYKYIKLEHKVVSAIWSDRGQWDLVIERANGSTFNDACDVLVNASGLLNSWKWPDIKGFASFKGPKIHSAAWDPSVTIDRNTTVGVIGNGSSAIQILPQLQASTKHVTTFIRTKTWISVHAANSKAQATATQRLEETGGIADASNPLAAPVAQGIKGALYSAAAVNPAYTEDEKAKFRADPAYHRQYRADIEREMNGKFLQTAFRGSPGAKGALTALTGLMAKRLEAKPELQKVLIPEWEVGCRRPTPGIGYLEALCCDNVTVNTSGIDHITEGGIVTKDGVEHKIDVLVCATGFDISNKPRFTFKGKDGYVFPDEWAASPKGYLSVTLANCPSYFLFNGPAAPFANGSLLPSMEAVADYILRAIEKMYKDDIRSMCIKEEAVEEFSAYSDAWMPRAVFSAPCRSWYKNGTVDGRVSALWPGSLSSLLQTLANPRFEDYDFTYVNRTNRFTYLGNGLTQSDVDENGDKAWYLNNKGLGI